MLAVAASDERTPAQIVLPPPHGVDLPHHACCRASASDRISRYRQISLFQRQSVPFPHGQQAVLLSAQRHLYRQPVLSARHTALRHLPTRQHIFLPALSDASNFPP